MKAPYSPPLFIAESFAMTQSVANNCTQDIPLSQTTLNDPHNCVWKLGMQKAVFLRGRLECTEDGELLGFACYNNPTATRTAFHS